MLKIRKKVMISGQSIIDGAEAAGFQAQVDTTTPEDMTMSNWQTNAQLYKENRDVCRADQAEFEDYAYSIQDRMIAELAAKQETEAPTEE